MDIILRLKGLMAGYSYFYLLWAPLQALLMPQNYHCMYNRLLNNTVQIFYGGINYAL